MSEQRSSFPCIAKSVEADFEAGTWTFEPIENFVVGAGRYALIPEANFIALQLQRDELLAALEGLHKVCEIALAGTNGKQHAYFETRSGNFVEASNAMQQAEAAIAKAKGGAA